VDGPCEVLTAESGQVIGGVLHPDLSEATRQALTVPRATASARACEFSWEKASHLFTTYLKQIKD
jgi:hypothetical protein